MKFESQRFSMIAATEIPSPPPPKKVSRAQLTLPSFLTTAKPNPDSALPLRDRQLANTDLTSLRTGTSSRTVIRDFVRASPDLSAAVAAQIRVGIPDGYTVVAKNLDGTYNPEGTAAANAILNRINFLPDYTIGYDDAPSLRSCSETLGREVLMYGGMAMELVLDKTLLPYKFQPVSVTQIKLYPSADGKRLRPFQEMSGQKISLDIPTFFMVNLDQDTLEAYSISPIEPALQGVVSMASFMNDLRRVIRKAVHPRVIVTIDEEKFRKSIPNDIRGDQEAVFAYMNKVRSDVENAVNNLNPEDALILFDTFGIEVVDHGNTNYSNEISEVKSILDAQTSAGAKTLPTVLGQANSTANAASTETLLFIKYVNGVVRAKLNEMYSKALTLGVRLMGQDVFVEFKYDEIDLKPTSELEAFYAMKQSRILALLSLGLVTDEQASVMLTGNLPPAGYTKLAGTGFMPNTGAQPAAGGDGYNGATNKGSATNMNTAPSTPTNPKSQNGGKRGNP